MAKTAKETNDIKIPSPHDWRTTDTDEINKRRLRAREESFTISNVDPQHPVFSNFRVASGSGLTYSVCDLPWNPATLEQRIDRATDEALQRLMTAGLIAKTTRASRPLFSAEAAAASAPLSAVERAKADASHAQSARKLKMAKLLGEGGLDEEARAPLREAIHYLARALAVEHRLPEPASLDDALLPPLSHCWNEVLPLLRSFVAEASQPCKPVADALDKMAPARNA